MSSSCPGKVPSQAHGPCAFAGSQMISANTDLKWVEQVQIALAALHQAAEVYQHGPANAHTSAFELALLAMRLAMEAMQEGSLCLR